MRLLLINIRYVYIGGPERYLFNLKQLLEANNHQVIPFSVRYPFNERSEYEDYFASSLSDDKSVYFKDQKWNARSIIRTLERNFYSKEVEKDLNKLISDSKPDFAIVLLYLRKLSPAVLVALHKNRVPFVVRLSDYAMICPGNNLFRDGNICELCVNGNLMNSVIHKCVHNLYSASIVNFAATKYHYYKGYFELIKHFISPSRFLIGKMIEGGYEREKFHHIPSFAYLQEQTGTVKIENQIVYAGRIEYIKGVHLLLEAVNIVVKKHKIKLKVKIAGNGNAEYINELKKYCSQQNLGMVEFAGNLNKNELMLLLKESAFSVIPSLWYDNTPNSALESLSCGTPVIAPDHGSFPELIINNETGFLFKPANYDDLSRKIKSAIENPVQAAEMRRRSVGFINKNHSPGRHYDMLISIIDKIKGTY